MLLSPAKVSTTIQNSTVSGEFNITRSFTNIYAGSPGRESNLFLVVNCNTNYPFSEQLSYTIESKTDFDFFVRIPEWTIKEDGSITIGNGEAKPLSPTDDGLQRVEIMKGSTELTVSLPMEIRTVTRDNSVAFYRGPLLYAAEIEHNATKFSPLDFSSREPLPENELHPDAYDVIFKPVAEWKFAVDPSTVKLNKGDEAAELPNPIFVSDGPPTSLEVDAYPIEWLVENGTAASPPVNPSVNPSERTTIKLIPYGAAKLHIAQFPIARLED